VHTAGIQFDYTFLIRQTTQTNRIVFGIVLRTLYDANAGIERVAAALEERVRRFHMGVAIVRTDDNRALEGIRLRGVTLAVHGKPAGNCSLRSYSSGNCSQH
jgi:hypothetical protein